MSSPNLAIAHMTAQQRFKEATFNAAVDQLDGSSNGILLLTITTLDITLTTTPNGGQALANFFFDCSGTLTGNRNVIVPTNKKRYAVRNNTSGAFTLTFKTLAGTGIAVPQGKVQMLYCDGTNIIASAAAI